MSTKLYSGYERTNREKLPEDGVKCDPRSPIGAATIAAVIRAQKTGDYDGIANALNLHNTVSVQDNTVTAPNQVVGKMETYIITDGKTTQKVIDTKALDTFIANGWTLTGVEHSDLLG